jgi:hypothetical protein
MPHRAKVHFVDCVKWSEGMAVNFNPDLEHECNKLFARKTASEQHRDTTEVQREQARDARNLRKGH